MKIRARMVIEKKERAKSLYQKLDAFKIQMILLVSGRIPCARVA